MTKPYRDCVVAVITYDFKYFLVGERAKQPGAWQFPQGGIDAGETPEQALLRELKEEIGTNEVKIIKESSKWFNYDFPPTLQANITKNFRGQRQKWYLVQMHEHASPNLEESDGEFIDLDWQPIDQIVANIIEWKRDSYHEALRNLALWEKSRNV